MIRIVLGTIVTGRTILNAAYATITNDSVDLSVRASFPGATSSGRTTNSEPNPTVPANQNPSAILRPLVIGAIQRGDLTFLKHSPNGTNRANFVHPHIPLARQLRFNGI